MKKRYRFNLTKLEKNVLFRKYYSLGLSPEKVRLRIQGIAEQLNGLVTKLRKKETSEEQIDVQFKEEFSKICEAQE